MVVGLLVSGDFPCEQADMGEEEPGGGAGNGGLEILCQPPVAIDPGEEAFDHPASGDDGEADLVVGLAHH